jgi:glucokinase
MNPSSVSAVLCVDIGGTSTKAGLVDSSGTLHGTKAIPTEPPSGSFFEALSALIAQTETAGLTIDGIGVGVAGFLNPHRDRLVYNPNIAWLEQFPLLGRLRSRFQMPVELESDSNSACMAEYRFGVGRKSKRFLCVTAGTGLGVGMAVGGEPLRFAYGCLGDIGHVIVEPKGPICYCGGRGCAEILVSAPALAERFAQRSGLTSEISLRDVIEAAHDDNPVALSILKEAGEHLGIAIASMANTLFPDHIAVAGGLSAAGDSVLKVAEQVFRDSASILAREGVTFSRAHLGPSATLIGAAWPFWKN